jgi:hypothetical protein
LKFCAKELCTLQVEPEVEPDSMSDDVGRKSVAGIINNGYG